jgi:hypothetical protein
MLSFGSFSERGAELAGCLYSVSATPRLAGISPWLWTLAYLRTCAGLGGKPPPGSGEPGRDREGPPVRYCGRDFSPRELELIRALAARRDTIPYRAANRIHVGQTQGRGKLDSRNLYALPVKHILLKPLHPRWRSVLNR